MVTRKLPITPMRMPSGLTGLRNGKLPTSVLRPIGVGSARMETTAARSFIAMFDEARRTLGVQIKHVGDYRPYEQQLSLFLSRYQPVSAAQYAVTSSAHRKKWDGAIEAGYSSTYWVKKKNPGGSYPATAATPGNSNHGWGLALDIAEEYDSDGAPDPIRPHFVEWLVGNAHRYGISAELQSEPWHWRYVAGDVIPAATLAFERSQGILGGNQGNPEPLPPQPVTGPGLVFAYPGHPIRRGSTNTVAVKLIQNKVGATPDGDFADVTERRVKNWQEAHGLLADGVVGAVTWKKMFG